MTRSWLPGVFLALGTGLAMLLILKAQPAMIVELFRRPSGPILTLAALCHVAILVTRAYRLFLLAGSTLSFFHAILLHTAAQTVAAVLPWRLGELALPPLARWTLRTQLSRAAFWWLAGRFFDLWSLGVVAALLALGGWLPRGLLGPAAALVVVLSLAASLSARRRPWKWLARLAPSRRWVKGLLRVRRLLAQLRRRPAQLLAVGTVSCLMWAAIVAFSTVVIAGMEVGLTWRQIFIGVLGATVGAALPLAGPGNLGPLEAGFAGALALAGVPPGQALAVGFALHLWTLTFHLAVGSPCLYLLLSGTRSK
ncbi:MAG: flippase-like domain-containing protein [Thermoanaerobaculum sp.]|nr:flippase-like domain-containing protein [Thermoanaerobaculum sp.]